MGANLVFELYRAANNSRYVKVLLNERSLNLCGPTDENHLPTQSFCPAALIIGSIAKECDLAEICAL